MTLVWLTSVLLAASNWLPAAQRIGVKVRVDAGTGSSKVLELTKALVLNLFQRIGIDIRWQETGEAGQDFDIHIIGGAPTTASPEALASTGLGDGSITVFQGRLGKRLSRAHPGAAKVALGYVFAHELAHAMQGFRHHSTTGILKREWSNDDFTAMLFHRLTFTAADVDLMRKGLVRKRDGRVGGRMAAVRFEAGKEW